MHGIVGLQSGTILSQISELGELKRRLSQITSHLASSFSGPNFEKPEYERLLNFLKPRLFFKPYTILEPFPYPIVEIIGQKVQAQHFSKIQAVQNHFLNLATSYSPTSRIRFSPSYWINPHKFCPNNPEPCNHSKINNHCVHTLDFYFLKASLTLHRYT